MAGYQVTPEGVRNPPPSVTNGNRSYPRSLGTSFPTPFARSKASRHHVRTTALTSRPSVNQQCQLGERPYNDYGLRSRYASWVVGHARGRQPHRVCDSGAPGSPEPFSCPPPGTAPGLLLESDRELAR
jgi:hypothetical protein